MNFAFENISVDFRLWGSVFGTSGAFLTSCSYWLAVNTLTLRDVNSFYFLFICVQTALWAPQYCVSASQQQHRKSAIALYHIHIFTQSSGGAGVPSLHQNTCFRNCVWCVSDLHLISICNYREKFNCISSWTVLLWAWNIHLPGTMLLKKAKSLTCRERKKLPVMLCGEKDFSLLGHPACLY